MALAAIVHHTHEVEAWALEVHTERLLVAIALDIHAEDATAGFHFLIPAACRQLDNLWYLGTDVAFRYVVDQLFEYLQTFFYFVETVEITVVAIAVFAHYLLEIEFVVD